MFLLPFGNYLHNQFTKLRNPMFLISGSIVIKFILVLSDIIAIILFWSPLYSPDVAHRGFRLL